MDGNLVRTITIEGVENNDWEDIAKDKNGFTYIGDFGNNDNDRKNLAIYKVKSTKKTARRFCKQQNSLIGTN